MKINAFIIMLVALFNLPAVQGIAQYSSGVDSIAYYEQKVDLHLNQASGYYTKYKNHKKAQVILLITGGSFLAGTFASIVGNNSDRMSASMLGIAGACFTASFPFMVGSLVNKGKWRKQQQEAENYDSLRDAYVKRIEIPKPKAVLPIQKKEPSQTLKPSKEVTKPYR